MRLKDIMSTDVEAIRPDESLERASTLMRLNDIHHLVVVDRRRVVGILTHDATERRRTEDSTATVAEAMARHVAEGSPDMTVRQAANLMRGRGEGALPVVDRGRLVGIITVADLLDVLGRGIDRPTAKPRRVLRHRGDAAPATLAGLRRG